jgi:hypothetical protein
MVKTFNSSSLAITWDTIGMLSLHLDCMCLLHKGRTASGLHHFAIDLKDNPCSCSGLETYQEGKPATSNTIFDSCPLYNCGIPSLFFLWGMLGSTACPSNDPSNISLCHKT